MLNRDPNKKSVLIVDPSRMLDELLGRIIGGTEDFEVCGEAADAYSAAAAVSKFKPDMIILASELPGGGRAKFLRRLIPQYACPVIALVSAEADRGELLLSGAADVLIPPDGTGIAAYREKLTQVMKNALNLREICCGGTNYKMRRQSAITAAADSDRRLIVIGGSTGSTEALPVILAGLANVSDCPPIAAAVHMLGGYSAMYAKRLTNELHIRACEARDGMRLAAGCVMIAQGAKHLRIASDGARYIARVSEGERISGHCPSVDALFLSAAALEPKRIIAVLLTGMGADGAVGLTELRKLGAFTIGQDEKTSVVYGMPKAAYDMGGVCRQSALENIAAEIKQKLKEWT